MLQKRKKGGKKKKKRKGKDKEIRRGEEKRGGRRGEQRIEKESVKSTKSVPGRKITFPHFSKGD